MAGHDIVDAEWEEVPDHGGNLHVARPTDRPSGQARHSTNPASPKPPRTAAPYGLADVRRFFRGLWRAFLVLLGILVLLFLFLAFGPAPEINTSSDDKGSSAAGPAKGSNKQMLNAPSQDLAGAPVSPTAWQMDNEWITGSWILTPTGGGDGRTRCADFAAAPIYRANGNTAKIMTFGPDGQYRDMFAYTTPSGEEHTTAGSATWQVQRDHFTLQSLKLQDAFTNQSNTPTDITARANGANVMLMGDAPEERYVRCVGPTSEIYGE
jgi:hypothetical protein